MRLPRALRELVGGAAFAQAVTIAILGTAVLAGTVRALIGWPGLIAILTVLLLLAVASIVSRDLPIAWPTAVPFSLLAFLGLMTLSIIWSQYQWATFAGLVYTAVFTVLGLYVALARDTIQIVRAFGDVLRFTLAASLAIEILSGLLIDTPIEFLGIRGGLASFGPIQGLLQSTNLLGLVAVIALVTFTVEARTRSVQLGLAIGSLALGAITVVLTRSAVVYGTAAVVASAMAALYLVRRAPSGARDRLQYGILGAGAVGAVVLWIFRAPIIVAFDAADVLRDRLVVWQQAMALLDLRPVEGWGWIGAWRTDLTPFSAFTAFGGVPTSARSAWVDVWFQLGLLGFAVFVGIVGLALVRSWLLAGRRRSVIFTWPAAVLVALIAFSFAESSLLIEFGWMTFVICAVKAGQEISWRKAFEAPLEADPPPVRAS